MYSDMSVCYTYPRSRLRECIYEGVVRLTRNRTWTWFAAHKQILRWWVDTDVSEEMGHSANPVLSNDKIPGQSSMPLPSSIR